MTSTERRGELPPGLTPDLKLAIGSRREGDRFPHVGQVVHDPARVSLPTGTCLRRMVRPLWAEEAAVALVRCTCIYRVRPEGVRYQRSGDVHRDDPNPWCRAT